LKFIHPLLNKIPITKQEDRVAQRSAQNCYNYVNVGMAITGTFEILIQNVAESNWILPQLENTTDHYD